MKFRSLKFNTETLRIQSFTEKTIPILRCDPLRSLRLCVKIAVLLLTTCFLAHAASTNDITSYVQRGLFEEEANHNLDAAMQAYQSAVTLHDKDRKLAATAIFRLGECLRKQGKTNEAGAYYQRIVNEFADQTELVKASEHYVGAPKEATSSPTANANQPNLNGQYREITTETAKAEALRTRVSKLGGDELVNFFTTIQPDQILIDLERERDNAVAKLNELSPKYGISNPDYKSELQSDVKLKNDRLMKRALTLAWSIEQKYKMLKEQEDALKTRLGQSNTSTAKANEPTTTAEEDEEIRKIKEMIQNSPDLINRAAENHYTPLQSAAIAGHLRVVQYLVEHGADINFGGMTYFGNDTSTITTPPLVYAAANGHNAIVAYLLSKGANVNAADGNGNTALDWAAIHDFLVVAQTLLAQNPNVNATNSSGRTALHIAAQNDEALVKLLLEHDADVNISDKKGETPLLSALRSRRPTIVQLLVSHNADVNVADATGFTPLLVAAQNDDLTSAQILLDKGADPEAQIPPHFSGLAQPYVSNNEIATYRAINFAIEKGDSKLLSLLLDHHANPNSSFTWYWNMHTGYAGTTPLMMAAIKNKPSIAEILLSRGAKVNSADEQGTTALHYAAKFSETNIADALLAHGAEVNAVAKNGHTPLFDAVCQQKPDTNMVALLIEHHADVNALNGQGHPPIHCVMGTPATPEQQAVREQLIKAGADPDYVRRQVVAIGRHDASGKLSTGISFSTNTNRFRQFTLLEMLCYVYEGKATGYYGGANGPYFDTPNYKSYGFPDFSRVIIHRLDSHGQTTDIKVNAAEILHDHDCGKDVTLVGGDIVELPEADHPIGQKWEGLTVEQQDAFRQCLQRTVTVKIKGSTTNLTICPPLPKYVYPGIHRRFGNEKPPELQGVLVSFCWLNDVLDSSGVLLASSDIARIKIVRPKLSKELVYNLASKEESNVVQMPWLDNGDVIEIPERDADAAAK